MQKQIGGVVFFINSDTLLLLGSDNIIYRASYVEHRHLERKNLKEGKCVIFTYSLDKQDNFERVTSIHFEEKYESETIPDLQLSVASA